MNKRLQGILAGFIVGVLFTTTAIGVFAATFQATTASFPIFIGGKEWKTDKEIVVINGSTYLPLRALGDALGVKVDWNDTLKRVEIGDAASTATQTTADDFTFSTKVTTKYTEFADWTQTTGEVTNNSGKDYSFVTVSATYYSSDGTVLGKGTATVQDIKNGQTKSFETLTSGRFDNAAKTIFQVDSKL